MAWRCLTKCTRATLAARHPLLTAHGTIPDAVQATARGVFTYLTKPYDGKELLEKVAEALALSALRCTRRMTTRRGVPIS